MNLQLSRTSDYAIRLTVFLAGQPAGRPVPQAEIARTQGIPEAYLQKFLPELARAGLVTARRGPRGGYALARDGRLVSVLQVIEAVDGPLALNLCVMHGGPCERIGRCAVHRVWRIAQRQLAALLEETSVLQLAREADAAPGFAGFGGGVLPDLRAGATDAACASSTSPCCRCTSWRCRRCSARCWSAPYGRRAPVARATRHSTTAPGSSRAGSPR
ncbi:MAG: Rrf2 family transcriptional regulator [Armatimonadetes bacterium]|nr:Rrf2 family transcriptional regulator [Armatimonadota bacterium]